MAAQIAAPASSAGAYRASGILRAPAARLTAVCTPTVRNETVTAGAP